MESNPNGFLVQVVGSEDATVATVGPWQQILQSASISVDSTSGASDVNITAGDDLWQLDFSSVSNAAYFNNALPAGGITNHAWVGDDLDSGVMVLSPKKDNDDTFTREFNLRGTSGGSSIWASFGISEANKQLNELVDVIDPAKDTSPVKVKLHEALKPDPNPNALWCMTTSEGFQTVAKLEFVLTVSDLVDALENSPVGKVITWVKDKLGLEIGFEDLKTEFRKTSKIPDILISPSKTTTYAFDENGQLITPPDVKWAVSIQITILDFNFAFDFSEEESTFYLLPQGTLSSIVSDLVNAVGSKTDGLDRSLMPSANTDDTFTKIIGNHLNLWYVHLDKTFVAETAPAPEPPGNATADGQPEAPSNTAATGEAVTPVATPASGDSTSSPLNWGVALLASWTIGGEKNIPVLIGLSYESRTKVFSGRLILADDPSVAGPRLPEFDHRIALPTKILDAQNIQIEKIQKTINLWDLFSDSGSPPKALRNIPFNVAAAEVQYQSFDADEASGTDPGSVVTFYMDLKADDPEPASSDSNGEAPSGGFVWNEISVLASRMSTKTSGTPSKSTTSLQVFSTMTLSPKNDSTINPATLNVALMYSNADGNTAWMLHGSVHNLSVALLADYFFDNDCSDGALAVLGKLNLSSLDIIYTYDSGLASSFLISAVLILGELELDLSYQYVSSKHPTSDKKTAAQIKWGDNPPNKELSTVEPTGKTEWKFEAFLRTTEQKSTIASITESIVPGKGNELPDFIGQIEVNATGDPMDAPIKLIYTGSNDNGSTLAVWVNLGSFNMTFIQYRSMAKNGQTPFVKKMLRISCDQIPMMDKVPLVNQLPQPFDHLVYLWVEDDDSKTKGFTRDMIDKSEDGNPINKVLEEVKIPEIQFKEIKKEGGDAKDVIVQAGHHFIVVSDGKVVLDHIFTPDKKTTDTQTNPQTNPPSDADTHPAVAAVGSGHVAAAATPPATEPAAAVPESPATKGDTTTQAGPLTVSALSVQYKNGSLFVGVDATLVIGPMTFSVIGFTIEVELNNPDHPIRLNNLADILTKGLVHVGIHGLEAGVDKPPLTLEGIFIHDIVISEGDKPPTSVESYRGGIAVGFKAWKVLAVGEYSIVTTLKPDLSEDPNEHQFKSIFIYGKLDGPLVELEFATISGVRLGFGYNSIVHLPKADRLYEFPFISDSAGAGGDDPRKILDIIKGGNPPFVATKEGACWFAAGMTITCFDCITLTAVLMFEIETKGGQNGVIIALLADGVFQMEPLAPPDFSLFYVELLIKVELNFIEGYIAADAALAPASHVYVPMAHLTGSGSFYTWFPPNSHAGDWVVTIGGYHRAYTPPDHYPQNLQRLGLNFVVGNAIHVVGGAYVAVTPKCAMAGGSLHISLDVGPVSAYADIALDVFINFKPFYFIAEIQLSVGVECDIDILFATIHISISLGADLTLWGPDSFGGTAYVHFWFFGFSIDFGDGLRDPPGISLKEMYEIVRTAGPNSEPPPGDKTSASNKYQAQHKYSIEEGLFPVKPKSDGKTFPNTGAATEWKVLAGPLQIRIDCDFALSAARIITKDDSNNPATILSEIDIKTTPDHTLNDIYAFPMHNEVPIDSRLDIRIYFLEGEEKNRILQTDFRAELVLKQAPKATWSKYIKDNDPLHRISPGQHNKPTSLESGTEPTVELCQGVRIFPPLAVLDQSPIVDFDATAAMSETVADIAIPDSDPEQDVFLAEAFEPDIAPSKQWEDFGKLWTGDGDVNEMVVDESGNKLDKKEMRGDEDGKGLLGLVVGALGWAVRRPVETVAGVVPTVMGKDGKVMKKEWELQSKPPTILAKELGYYYPYLPLTTGSLVAATA